MGLDVTIKRFENINKYKRLNDKYEKATEKIWDDEIKKLGKENYHQLSQKEKDSIDRKVKKYQKENNCDEWNEPNGLQGVCFEYESKLGLPKSHLFAPGYFRSSYNSAGFNSVLPQMLGKDITLYSIFGKDDNDEYHFVPDWEESLKRVKSAIRLLKSRAKKGIREVMTASPVPLYNDNDVKRPKNKLEALKLFQKQLNKDPDYCYSCRDGEFMIPSPITVEALITGVDHFKNPCVYAVYKTSPDNIKWYEEALLIVKENIENVLLTGEPEKHVLCWSA